MSAYRYGPALRVPGVGLVDVSAWRNHAGAWVLQVTGCAAPAQAFYGYTLREARRLYARRLADSWGAA